MAPRRAKATESGNYVNDECDEPGEAPAKPGKRKGRGQLLQTVTANRKKTMLTKRAVRQPNTLSLTLFLKSN